MFDAKFTFIPRAYNAIAGNIKACPFRNPAFCMLHTSRGRVPKFPFHEKAEDKELLCHCASARYWQAIANDKQWYTYLLVKWTIKFASGKAMLHGLSSIVARLCFPSGHIRARTARQSFSIADEYARDTIVAVIGAKSFQIAKFTAFFTIVVYDEWDRVHYHTPSLWPT